MAKIERILVAVDFTDGSRSALDYGVALARRLAAQLKAVHVVPPHATYEPLPTFPEPAALDPRQRRTAEDQLRRFVTPPGAELPLVETLVREGDAADEILAEAAASEADLVVLGTHGRRGFERLILGSVTDRVARKADRPVLAVPPSAAAPGFTRVLCALDLTDSSAATLHHATAVARAVGAELVVLYVADGPQWYEPWPISGLDIEAVQRAVSEAAGERLRELVAREVPPEVRVHPKVVFGRAHQEIERMAGEGVDLVVLGASSSRAIERFFFGSTAQHVLRSGVCPVLLVRHGSGAEEKGAGSA